MDMDRFMSATSATRDSMLREQRLAEAQRTEAMRAALMDGLSGTQEWALNWLRLHGPALRREWRNAGIAARTMSSLVHRGLAATDDQRRAFAQW